MKNYLFLIALLTFLPIGAGGGASKYGTRGSAQKEIIVEYEGVGHNWDIQDDDGQKVELENENIIVEGSGSKKLELDRGEKGFITTGHEGTLILKVAGNYLKNRRHASVDREGNVFRRAYKIDNRLVNLNKKTKRVVITLASIGYNPAFEIREFNS